MSCTTPRLFAGIDWAEDKHDVCVRSPDGVTLKQWTLANTAVELAALGDHLSELVEGENEAAFVAIEIPHGPVVETLLYAGFTVFSINTKQSDRFRDRFSLPGAKDDRLDALVLADSLRTDTHLFRRLEVDSPHVIELRQWSRLHDELQRERNGLANRFRQQLRRYYSHFLTLGDVTESWVLDLWERAPTPERGRRLQVRSLGRLLAARRIRRITPDELAAKLRVPAMTVAPGTAEAASSYLQMLLPRLRLVIDQVAAAEKHIKRLLDGIKAAPLDSGVIEQRDVVIMLSFPGLGILTAATLLAEASQALKTRNYHAIRAHGGVAPITRRSGKGRPVVVMRQACSDRLRNGLYHWARVATQVDATSRARYAALRARGHRHGRACRTVADRLVATLCAALRDGTTYDPALRRGTPTD